MPANKPSFRELLLGGPAIQAAQSVRDDILAKNKGRKGELKARDRIHLESAEAVLHRQERVRMGVGGTLALGALLVAFAVSERDSIRTFFGKTETPSSPSQSSQALEEAEYESLLQGLDPLPTFKFSKVESPLVLIPEGLELSPEEFQRVSEQFTAQAESSFNGYFSQEPGSPEESSNIISVWTKAMMQKLASIHPQIQRYIRSKSALLDTNVNQRIAFINRFLIRSRRYFAREMEGTGGRAWTEIGRIAGVEQSHISYPGREIEAYFIAIDLDEQAPANPFRIPLEKRHPARADLTLSAVQWFPESIERTVGNSTPSSYASEDPALYRLFQPIFEKEGTQIPLGQVLELAFKQHESAHILLNALFPEIAFNENRPETQVGHSLSLDEKFPGQQWHCRERAHIFMMHELGAIGVGLAGMANYGPHHAIMDLLSRGRKNRVNQLAYQYLLHGLATLPGLSPQNQQRMRRFIGSNGIKIPGDQDLQILLKVAEDPAVTTQRIREIGHRMWTFSLRAFAQASASVPQFSR